MFAKTACRQALWLWYPIIRQSRLPLNPPQRFKRSGEEEICLFSSVSRSRRNSQRSGSLRPSTSNVLTKRVANTCETAGGLAATRLMLEENTTQTRVAHYTPRL